LLRKAANLGLPLDAAVEAKQFHMVWQPPLEASIDAVAERLFATIEQHGVRRLFIDGLNGLQQSADYGERLPRFLAALSQELRARNVTTLMSTELETMFGPTVHITLPGVSAISENLLFLRYVELRSQLYRLLSIIKMRESEHDASIREFAITNEGIKVDATFATAEAILTGVAHPSQAAEGPPPLQQRLSSKQSRAADAT
jgi:circadian clock protein KaiC